MRAGDRYDCGRCDKRSVPRAHLCDLLCSHARDESGNAPPPPNVQRFEWNEGLGHVESTLAKPVFALGMLLGRARRQRQIARLVEAAGAPEPIARVHDGLSCVEGHVEVLVPVASPHEEPVAAFAERTVRVERRGTTWRTRSIAVRREHGRFLVRDATGIALIDDDWLRLFDADGREPDALREASLVLRAGDLVRVVGYAHRGGVGPLPITAASLRGPPVGVRFEGGTRRPVCVFLPRAP